MTSESSVPPATETIHTPCERPFHRSLCWGAVLAGTVVAVAIHLLLLALGVGGGLAIFRHLADTSPVTQFSDGINRAYHFPNSSPERLHIRAEARSMQI